MSYTGENRKKILISCLLASGILIGGDKALEYTGVGDKIKRDVAKVYEEMKIEIRERTGITRAPFLGYLPTREERAISPEQLEVIASIKEVSTKR